MDTSRPPKPRLRDLGITVGTLPTGAYNAITDVPGVRVGHSTIVAGEGAGAVRTGVTAIHPHEGSAFRYLVPAAIGVLNGAGEITGRSQVDEYGTLESPILLTSTHEVGVVHRAVLDWLGDHEPELGPDFCIPVVAETYDGFLNATVTSHVTREHVFAALDDARGGPVAEGNVGGGTGMMLFQFKGGIGSASRLVEIGGESYRLGVLVQGNFGQRSDLLVDGVPVGLEIGDLMPERGAPARDGSIIVVIGTDAPLSDRQLGRLCRRGMLGLGRVGSTARNSSGDLLLAFSNAPANRVERRAAGPLLTQRRLGDDHLNDLFQATIEATAEAVLNALVAAETLRGRDGHLAHALPRDRLRAVMRRYGRLRG